jgi:hypothetical protein
MAKTKGEMNCYVAGWISEHVISVNIFAEELI